MPTIFSLDAIATQFYGAAVTYSNAIRPYAFKLFFALFLIELLVTFIQYTADGQIDPISYFGRMVRQLLGAGFVLAMITYGFQWMYEVIRSFSRLGSIISGLPALSPDSILAAGENLAMILWNSPTTTGVVSAFEMALVEGVLALVVLAAFVWVAGELLLTLVRAYLTIGLGVILLSFGGNRFTSNAAEGYFTNVLRVGIKILFMYAVLAIGMQIVTSLEASLTAACKPATTAVPWITTYFTPPTGIITTVCTGTISLGDMVNYAVVAVVFALLCAGIPRMAADLAGGTLGHALEDLAAVYYLGRNVGSPIGREISHAVSRGVREALKGASEIYSRRHVSETAMQSFAADAAAQARARSAAAPTKPLNPFNGQPPGYNMRRNAYGVQPTQALNPSGQPNGAKATTKI